MSPAVARRSEDARPLRESPLGSPSTGGRWVALALGVLLSGLIFYPKVLTENAPVAHNGIASPTPTIATYSLVILLWVGLIGFQMLTGRARRIIPLAHAMLLLLLLAGVFLAWPGSPLTVSGASQYAFGVAALGIGVWAGPRVFRDPKAVQLLAMIVLGVIAVEALVAAAQRAGVGINPMAPETAALMGDRVNGTTKHPNNLGKILVLLLIPALGFAGSQERRIRLIGWTSVLLTVPPLVLCQGRSTMFAAVATILLWTLLSGRAGVGRYRWLVPALIAAGLAPFLGVFAERLAADPEGGERAHLTDVALEQIGAHPFWGTGPNNYVDVIAQFDPVVALGYPVHNAFLLSAAELGLLAALLFWWPFAVVVRRAWIHRRAPGLTGSLAGAVVGSLPGLVVINYTGWSMLSLALLPLWTLIIGLAYSQFTSGGPGFREAWGRTALR